MNSVPSFGTAVIVAIAALAGTLIGLAGTFAVARRNLKKEVSLKMAEFRIKWIDKLGDELSDFIEKITLILIETDKDKVLQLVAQVNRTSTRIALTMNTKDENYEELNKCMNELMKFASEHAGKPFDARPTDKYSELRKRMISICNKILKNEWRKTKKHLREDTVEVSALRSETDLDWVDRIDFCSKTNKPPASTEKPNQDPQSI